MHDVRADLDKNRIYITVGKLADEAEMQSIVDEVRAECRKLRKGFTCLTDLRNYEFQDEKFEVYIKLSQKELVDAGMSKVVRVHRPTGLLGHYQFDNVSFEVGYHAQNATSIAEAEQILDGKDK